MATESLQSGPYPASSAVADVPADIQAAVVWAASKVVMTFASAAARTSAFSAAGVSPTAGMLCYRADAPGLNKFEAYNATASAWRVHGAYQDSVTVTGSAAASAAFSSIPTYLKRLSVSMRARSTQATGFVSAGIQVGGDTSASYKSLWHYLQNGGATGGATLTAATSSAFGGYLPGASASAGLFGTSVVDLTGWDKPSGNCLGVQAVGGFYDSASLYINARGTGEYIGSSSYNSLTIVPSSGSWDVGSEFELIGFE